MIYSSRIVISLDTRVPEERNRILKLNQELDLLDMGEKKLYRTGMIDFYYGRLKNAEFDNMWAAQFFAEYNVHASGEGEVSLIKDKAFKIVKRG